MKLKGEEEEESGRECWKGKREEKRAFQFERGELRGREWRVEDEG